MFIALGWPQRWESGRCRGLDGHKLRGRGPAARSCQRHSATKCAWIYHRTVLHTHPCQKQLVHSTAEVQQHPQSSSAGLSQRSRHTPPMVSKRSACPVHPQRTSKLSFCSGSRHCPSWFLWPQSVLEAKWGGISPALDPYLKASEILSLSLPKILPLQRPLWHANPSSPSPQQKTNGGPNAGSDGWWKGNTRNSLFVH